MQNKFNMFVKNNFDIINELHLFTKSILLLDSYEKFRRNCLVNDSYGFSLLGDSEEKSTFEKKCFNLLNKEFNICEVFVSQREFDNYKINYKFKVYDRIVGFSFDLYNDKDKNDIDNNLFSIFFADLDFLFSVVFFQDKIEFINPINNKNNESNISNLFNISSLYLNGKIKNMYTVKTANSNNLDENKKIKYLNLFNFFTNLETLSENKVDTNIIESLLENVFFKKNFNSSDYDSLQELIYLISDVNCEFPTTPFSFDLNETIDYKFYKKKKLKDTNYFKESLKRINKRKLNDK